MAKLIGNKAVQITIKAAEKWMFTLKSITKNISKNISKSELYAEIVVSKGTGKLTERAKELLTLLAYKAICKNRYYYEEDAMDCLQTGLLNLFSNWYKFSPERSDNAFAYLTEIFKRGTTAGLWEIYKKKGDPDNKIKIVQIHSANDGEGMFNL